jgi:hypothetical protein
LSASSANLSSRYVPPPVMKPRRPRSLFSFILRASARSPTAWLPTKSMSSMRTFGPSSMLKVRWTVFGPPATGLISGLISAYW